MTAQVAIVLLGAVLTLGALWSRRVQRGYIDFLTPLLAMYFLHTFTRGVLLLYLPEWLDLNPLVAGASDREITEALFLAATSVALFIAGYLAVCRLAPAPERAVGGLSPVSMRAAASLIGVGLCLRLVLRLATDDVIALPDWALTPVDTFSWAGLAGVFLAGFNWARSGVPSERNRGALLAVGGALVIIAVDARLSVSREAVLQPILAALAGRLIGDGASILRIAVYAAILGVPLFVWIGAMKTYRGYDLGPGPGYVESVAAVREHFGRDWAQFVVGSVQDRMHGLDSLIVCRAIVPALRPYETGSVWSQVVLSAFVPRAFFPEKQVGWGTRFAVEFWGMRPEDEGLASVGISHLGEFYLYGGDLGCLTGMAILGAGLGMVAYYLRRRADSLGLVMFVLVALTICQVDRDLDVTLGGVLKLLTIFTALMLVHSLRDRAAEGRGSRVSRAAAASPRPDIGGRG